MKVGGAAIAAVGGATAGLTGALVKGTGDVAAYGDNIDKMSQKMGLSIEAYQEWDAIMQHSGTSIDSLQAGMKTLANAVESGNDAFTRLGITEEDIASMNNEELFSATISALQNVENETERTYLAGQLLGRGATELGALLNTSAEDTEAMRQRVHELGGVMSEEAVKSAAAYQDSLQDMQTAFTGLKRGMLSDFLPSLVTVMDGLTEIFSGNEDGGIAAISDGISDLVDQISAEAPKMISAGSQIVVALLSAITDNLPLLLGAGADAVLTIGTGLLTQLPEIIKAGLQVVISLAQGISDNLPELIPTVVDVVLQIVDTLTEPSTLEALLEASLAIILAIASGLIDALPRLLERAPEIITNLTLAIIDAVPELLKAAAEIVVTLVNGVKDLPEKFREAGGNLMAGLIEGVKSRVTDAVNAVKDVAGNIVGTVKNVLGIHSPSTVFEDVGENIVAGLSEGIEGGGLESSAKYLGDYTKGLGANVTKQLPTIQKAGTAIMTTLQTAMDGYRNTRLKNFIPSVIQTITSTLASRHGDIIQSGVDIIIRIIDGMNNTLGTLVDSVHTVVTRMVTTARGRYGDFVRTGEYFIEGLWEGMENRSSWLENRVDSYISYIKSWVDYAFGIWSPSRWAKSRGDYIMQGLSLGMENGLDDVLDTAKSVSDSVKDSLDFGTQSVDFASSGLGASSAAMINGISGAAQGGGGGTLTVNFVVDGRVLATETLQDFIDVANANGTPIYAPA